MAPAAAVTPLPVSDEPPMSNGCAQVEAMDRQTAAMREQTATMSALLQAIEAGVEAFKPAAEEIRDLGQAQKKLCNFVVGNRLKIVGSLLGGLVAIGAISPNAAHLIATFLSGAGLQ